MTNRAVALAGVISCAVGGLSPGFAAARPLSVLAAVAELDRPVTAAETKVPLGELVMRVGKETGVRLTAAPEVADEPVAVAVKAMPARRLLEQLAALLDYQWSRHGKEGEWRYVLWQDLASRQREEALRQGVFADVAQRFEQEVKHLAEMAALSPEQLRQILEEPERRQEELEKLTPEQRAARMNSPEELERRRRWSDAYRLWSPVNRALATLLGRLSPEDWSLLQQTGNLRFSTAPQPGELPLPGETARSLRAALPGLYRPAARVVVDPEMEAEVQRREQQTQAGWNAATGYQVSIRLITHQSKSSSSVSLTAEAAPLRDGAAPSSLLAGPGVGTRLSLYAIPEAPAPPAEEEASQRRIELAADPVVGVRKLFQPESRPGPTLSSAGRRTSWLLRELLPELARTYHIQIISDAYWNAPVIMGAFPAREPTPLFELLDRYAGSTHCWDHQGDLIRLRSRTWFFDRPREIPLRFARRWQAICEQRGALPLEEYVALATSLSDGQLETLGALVREVGLPPELSRARSARHALRLYGSLSRTQQQAVGQGAALPVAPLSPSQRDLFLSALQESDPYLMELPDLAQCPDGSLSMSSAPFGPIGGSSAQSPVLPAASSPHPVVAQMSMTLQCPRGPSETVTLIVAPAS